MNYLLDTNIILLYGRDSKLANRIEKDLQLFSSKNTLAISVVTLGELNSLEKQFRYGNRRIKNMNQLISGVFHMGINFKKIIEKYGEIDAYSQGKLANKVLGMTSRNMGKNDLWIAATASAYDLKLITTDKDFNHLHHSYLDLEYIEMDKYLE